MTLKIVRALRIRLIVCAFGVTLTLLGLIGIALALRGGPDNMEIFNMYLTAVITGVLLLGLGVLASYRITVEEAYNLGRDIGIEKGFKDGREVGKPVVVDLIYPKDEVQIRRHPE